MGGCCSCNGDAIQQDRDESEIRNPKTPYANWAELIKSDWGSDPTAVSRDYPRMRLHVSCADGGPKSRVGDIRLTDDPAARASIHRRNSELRDVTLAISRLVEPPGSDVPVQLETAWRRHIEGDDTVDASPDVSSGLDAVFKDLGWYTDRSDVRTEAERTPTFNALLCMAQGTAFYPSQRLGYLTWVPWAPHLRDVGWTVYVSDDDVYPSPEVFRSEIDRVFHQETSVAVLHRRGVSNSFSKAEGGDVPSTPHDDDYLLARRGGVNATPTNERNGTVSYGAVDTSAPEAPALPHRELSPVGGRSGRSGTVSITHAFQLQNYVDSKEKAYVPRFEIQWSFTITLQKTTGNWVTAAIEQPRVFVVRPTASKLQRLRAVRLNDAVFNAFGVELEQVEELPSGAEK